jgi:hypothetical protein
LQALVHPRSESVAFVGFIIKETELIADNIGSFTQ